MTVLNDTEDYLMAKKKKVTDIKSVTWNLYNFTTTKQNQPHFDRLDLLKKPDIIFLQEVNDNNIPNYRKYGYKAIRGGQYATIYNPERFEMLVFHVSSVGEYYTTKGEKRTVRSLNVIFKDKLNPNKKQTLYTQNYHLPAGVQKPKAPQNRIKSGIEAAKHWRKIVRSVGAPILMAGDDNVDENTLYRDRWWYLRKAYTGLRIVRAPKPTHGKRKIDDFRIRGFRPVGKGYVWKTPSDHNLYGRTFRYMKKFR